MQLNLAGEAIGALPGDSGRYLERAKELARFGLAEARRTVLCLRPIVWDKIGLTESLKMLIDHSNIPGRLPCSLSVYDSRADDLPAETQQHLFRIAQEAISNAVRHANPTAISVSLRSEGGYLELRVRDDGCGISAGKQLSQHSFGLINMQDRAQKIGADLQIHGTEGHGTTVVVRLPSIDNSETEV